MSPFCEARVSSRVLPSLTADLVRPLDSRLRDHGFAVSGVISIIKFILAAGFNPSTL